MSDEQAAVVTAEVSDLQLKRAEAVLGPLGLSIGDAVNLLLVQIVKTQALPFEMNDSSDRGSDSSRSLLTCEEQVGEWTETMGVY